MKWPDLNMPEKIEAFQTELVSIRPELVDIRLELTAVREILQQQLDLMNEER